MPRAHISDLEGRQRRLPVIDNTMQPASDILVANGLILHALQARSSVGERFVDTEEVGSSILPVPTIF